MGFRRLFSAGLGCSLGFAALTASAEEPVPVGQGIVGGALVAGEVTVLTQAVLGVESTWAYVLGGTLSAAAGGYAGHLVEQNADPDVSAWLLGGGLAFLIPTVIWVGNARGRKRPVDRAAPKAMAFSRTLPGAPPIERRSEIHLPLLRGVF